MKRNIHGQIVLNNIINMYLGIIGCYRDFHFMLTVQAFV